MNKDDYQNKIEEHRKPIHMNENVKVNTRTSRRSNNELSKKTKQKSNVLLPILFFFFILIPVTFLVYVFAFYQPNSNETTILANTEVRYEQNQKETKLDDTFEDSEIIVKSTEVEDTSEDQVVQEASEEEVLAEETTVEAPPIEEPSSTNKTHVVQSGETLYRIAMNYYNSPEAVEQIKSANGLTSNAISTGQILMLP